jgi:hypothetical protein
MSSNVRLILESDPDEDSDTLTDELLGIINANKDVLRASRETDNAQKQDAGAIIGVILASASVTALAGGIADWIRSKNGVKVKVTCPDGPTVEAETIDGTTAVTVIEMFLKRCKQKQS